MVVPKEILKIVKYPRVKGKSAISHDHIWPIIFPLYGIYGRGILKAGGDFS